MNAALRSAASERLFALLALAATLLVATACESPADGAAEDAAAPLSAESQNALAALPAGAAFLGAADARAFAKRGLFGRVRSSDNEMSVRLRDFLDATGFDPTGDIRKVYVAVPDEGEASGERPQFVVDADFDRARFEEQLGEAWSSRFEKETHRGQPLYRSTAAASSDDDRSISFALTDGGLILLAPRAEDVRQMLDRLDAGTRSARDDEATMRRAERVRRGGDAWFVARGLAAGPFSMKANGQNGQMGRIGEVIQRTAGSVSMNGDVAEGTLFLHTRPGAASDLQEVIEGMVAAADGGERSARERRTLESIDISRSAEDVVRVGFALPAGE